MFGWLAKMLVTSPIQGSGCSCCEGKKKKLEQMQQAIAEGEAPQCTSCESKMTFSSGSFSAHVGADGKGEFAYYPAKNASQEAQCCCGDGSCGCGGAGDDVCHCGRGDDCCKKSGKKHSGCSCGH